ncbi:MAG TPA: ATP-dependent DNA ligase [Firmicutes bacterium]|jgi:DNA ligase D-like protein (predicted ligase)|nr:ATP-dependent DNA ligase [Bacillota bacterium]
MLPENFEPMLATLSQPFDSAEYTYEIKWDGYRCLAFLDSHTRLQSRNQKDLTATFPELQNLHSKVKKPGCLVDGEIIALRDHKPSFLELQKRAQLKNPKMIAIRMNQIPVVYVAFDLIYYDYQPIYNKPLHERRSFLYENFEPADEMILTSYIETNGMDYFKSISELGLEGVVAKKKESVYLPGKRSKYWLKFKRKIIQNFVVCGYLVNPEKDPPSTLRSLLLGSYIQNRLSYFGLVGNGFTASEMESIPKELKRIQTEICPFTGNNKSLKNTYWVRPLVTCEVEYLELTDDGSLRHPLFKRFRPEIRPENCQYKG